MRARNQAILPKIGIVLGVVVTCWLLIGVVAAQTQPRSSAATATGVDGAPRVRLASSTVRGGTTPATVPRTPTAGASTPPAALDQPGTPAIRPVVVSNGPSVPSFTADDMRAYLATHRHPNAVSDATPTTVAGVEFLPAHAVDERLGGGTGMRLVTLHGSFAASGPPGLQGTGDWSSGIAYLVFDARTGNDVAEAVGR